MCLINRKTYDLHVYPGSMLNVHLNPRFLEQKIHLNWYTWIYVDQSNHKHSEVGLIFCSLLMTRRDICGLICYQSRLKL